MPATYLATEPFRVRLAAWLERQDRGKQIAPLDYLAMQAKVDRSWLEKLLRGEYQQISFDKADRLMCAMNIAHEWLTNPDFREMYLTFDLAHLDRTKPLHKRRHNGGARRKVNYTQIAHHLRGGMSRARVKELTGASDSQLDRIVKTEKLSGRVHAGTNGVPRSFDYAEAKRLHDEEGLTWVAVAERLDVDKRIVYQAMRRVRQGRQELFPAA